MLLVSVAGANAAGAPAAAVPLLPAELSTLVTAAIRNHPAARSAQAKRRAASQAMTLRIEQTLWDNGAGDSRISAIATTADISALQVTLEQQDLAVQTINAWEAMLSAQRRMRLADVRTKQGSQRWLFNPASCGKVGDLVIPHAANVEVSGFWVSQIETTDAGGGCHGQAFR